MRTKKIFSLLCLLCYLTSGNIFAHVASMDLMDAGETEMVMSDCGMMMAVSTNEGEVNYNCFERCFGDYDDFSNTEIDHTIAYKYFTTVSDFFCCGQKSLEHISSNQAHAPPNEHCIAYGKQTPYFSHKDTTQIE